MAAVTPLNEWLRRDPGDGRGGSLSVAAASWAALASSTSSANVVERVASLSASASARLTSRW